MKSQQMEQIPVKDGHGVMNVHFFSTEFFPTDFLKVSYTCSSNYSVYDGVCTHTHLSHAHFLRTTRSLHNSHIFMRVTYTHGSSLPRRFFAQVSHLSTLFSPVSCLTHLCCSCTVTSRPLPTMTSLTIPST